MPVYNEAATVSRALEEVLGTELPANRELIVVDDGSTDGSTDLIDEASAGAFEVIHHDRNRGKGSAIRTGIERASGNYTAIFDADLEYHASDLGLLLEPLIDDRANAAFGVRAFDGFTSHSFLYVLGNRGVTLAANVLFNVYLRDLMTCHKVIRTELFQSLELRETGFAIEAEITARLLQQGERIYELPVEYRARSNEEGKKLTALDGLRVLRTLVRSRLSPSAAAAPRAAAVG